MLNRIVNRKAAKRVATPPKVPAPVAVEYVSSHPMAEAIAFENSKYWYAYARQRVSGCFPARKRRKTPDRIMG